jgi:NAD(P)-dependent dehydrogenase (short-subunit alcohol dehydrogenase family)
MVGICVYTGVLLLLRTTSDHAFQAASQRMVRAEAKGKIIMVSSILGWMSIVGYSSYAPAKFALRGKKSTHHQLHL